MTTTRAMSRARGSLREQPSGMVRDSVRGSVWTIVSRGTGLGQSIAVAVVLGATYLGNTYQAINSLPNIVYYQLLAGSLFVSILVPPIVARRDRGDTAGAETLARGFYGALLVAAVGFCLTLIVAGPWILRALTSGVADPTMAAQQRAVGALFLGLFVPQIVFYVTAGTGAAVMNAQGRFALAAGAPAIENIGMIATLSVAGLLFGMGTRLADVTKAEIVLLGLGTTASVAAHACAQWLGARSCGVRLVPRAGWRDPDVRRVLRRVVPMLGYTGLAAAQTLAALVIANRVAGGLVAFQLALNFFFLPIAVFTWPIARSMLPRLARSTASERPIEFWDELCRSLRLASFVTVPTAIGYIVLATPIARAIALGQLEIDGGAPLVAMALGALGVGVIGETWFILGTYAFYARQEVGAPLRSMAIRVATAGALLSTALIVRRPVALLIVGLSISAGSVVGAVHLWTRLRTAAGGTLPVRPLLRTLGAAVAMAVPTLLAAAVLPRWIGSSEPGQILVVIVAAAVGAGTFVAAQAAWGAPEFSLLRVGIGALARREDPAGSGAR